jgi:hypothetical protein
MSENDFLKKQAIFLEVPKLDFHPEQHGLRDHP